MQSRGNEAGKGTRSSNGQLSSCTGSGREKIGHMISADQASQLVLSHLPGTPPRFRTLRTKGSPNRQPKAAKALPSPARSVASTTNSAIANLNQPAHLLNVKMQHLQSLLTEAHQLLLQKDEEILTLRRALAAAVEDPCRYDTPEPNPQPAAVPNSDIGIAHGYEGWRRIIEEKDGTIHSLRATIYNLREDVHSSRKQYDKLRDCLLKRIIRWRQNPEGFTVTEVLDHLEASLYEPNDFREMSFKRTGDHGRQNQNVESLAFLQNQMERQAPPHTDSGIEAVPKQLRITIPRGPAHSKPIPPGDISKEKKDRHYAADISDDSPAQIHPHSRTHRALPTPRDTTLPTPSMSPLLQPKPNAAHVQTRRKVDLNNWVYYDPSMGGYSKLVEGDVAQLSLPGISQGLTATAVVPVDESTILMLNDYEERIQMLERERDGLEEELLQQYRVLRDYRESTRS
ncbi:hypothetical protein BJ742DRAFT_768370 [Cladochytrium replicatum]|nr:hypothetical protein BJ742DRAFT_768370 [Cladochytrium replicatum]